MISSFGGNQLKKINAFIYLLRILWLLFSFCFGAVYGRGAAVTGENNCLETDDNISYLVIGSPLITFIGSFHDSDRIDQGYFRTAFTEFLVAKLSEKNISFSVDSLKKIGVDTLPNDSVLKILKKYKCNRCIIPLKCTIKKRSLKNTGWREERFGSSYERPEKTFFIADVILKIINSDGEQLLHLQLQGKSKRPFMYGFFRRFAKKNTVTSLAESLYGPPALKALYNAVTSFCIVQSSDR